MAAGKPLVPVGYIPFTTNAIAYLLESPNITNITCSFFAVDEKERADGHDPEKELADSGFHDYHRP